MTFLRRLLRLIGLDLYAAARREERARCVVMVEAEAERWHAMQAPEIADDIRALAVRMRLGR